MTAAAAGFLSVPSVFQLSDNMKANAALYVQLQGISDQLNTFAQIAITKKPDEINGFLMATDKAINSANQISVTFDLSRAPSIQDIASNAATSDRSQTDKRTESGTGAGSR